MNCAALIISASEKASAGERPPPLPPLYLGPNHTSVLTLGERCSTCPWGIHCWDRLGGMEQEGYEGTDPVKEGSKEDAHEQSTIQAAGLTPVLPLPASSVPICTCLGPAPCLDPEFSRGLPSSQAVAARLPCSCLGKPCSAILFFSLPDASSLQPLSSPHALLCRIVPEIRNKRRGKKIGWIWGGGGGVSLPLSFFSSRCLPI